MLIDIVRLDMLENQVAESGLPELYLLMVNLVAINLVRSKANIMTNNQLTQVKTSGLLLEIYRSTVD